MVEEVRGSLCIKNLACTRCGLQSQADQRLILITNQIIKFDIHCAIKKILTNSVEVSA